jgi:hypothetical protein
MVLQPPRVLDKKKDFFALLRENILFQKLVSFKTPPTFTGKCISFMLAVPAARLYTRVDNLAISEPVRPVAFKAYVGQCS